MSGDGGNKGGGRQDAGPKRTVAQKYTAPKVIGVDKFGNKITQGTGNYKTINEKGKTVGSTFISEGANKSNRSIDNLPFGGTKIVATMLKKPLAKGAKYNRKAFENLVIGNEKAGSNIRINRAEWDAMSDAQKEKIYSTHQKNRMAGKTDFYGRTVRQGGDGGGAIASSGQVVQAPAVTAPTTAEVSQATTTDATEDSLILRKRKAKAKGRNPTIMTGVTGVTADLTLGKPSLLGRA